MAKDPIPEVPRQANPFTDATPPISKEQKGNAFSIAGFTQAAIDREAEQKRKEGQAILDEANKMPAPKPEGEVTFADAPPMPPMPAPGDGATSIPKPAVTVNPNEDLIAVKLEELRRLSLDERVAGLLDKYEAEVKFWRTKLGDDDIKDALIRCFQEKLEGKLIAAQSIRAK